jgi:tRNA nucleotidyltransferase (CCA-adding enzyme)
VAALERFESRATALLANRPPLSLSELAVDGKALMTDAGFKPGREIGRALEALLELVLEEPALNTREQLLERARALAGRP